MTTKKIFITALALAASTTACSESKESKLTLTGSSTVAPIMMEIAKRYEASHPGTRIDVQTGGSGRGITDSRAGVVDFGMVSRALKADETDLTASTVALDGITMILHSSNPITALSKQQITDIYTGRIANWKEVGGQDAPITVINKADGRSTLELFLLYFGLKPGDVKAHVIVGDNPQGLKTLAGNPNSIAYVSIGSAEQSARAGEPVKLLPMDGIAATTANVKNGSFPLSRKLSLVSGKNRELSATAKDFLAFTLAKEQADIVEAQYFVAVDR